jgi:nucleoside-diphosphate-sugar epimerase
MKVLFIGGTGVISSACSELALARGIKLYLLNRGQAARPASAGAHVLSADIRDRAGARAALAGHTFDAVVDWVAFTPEHVAADIELFRGRTGQYVFISSATVYEKPPSRLPITESTPLGNPFWAYAANKLACEELLRRAHRTEQFPVTIVRPSHTYDRTKLPTLGGYTAIARLREGKPAVVHGDGASLWVLTHHRDFAVGFVGLLGNPRAVGEAFHITSDELLTWNQIYSILAWAAGAEPRLIHVPSEIIARFDPELGAGLLGDKAHSVIFDNSKIRTFVPDFAPAIPFASGAQEIMAWYDADPARQAINPALDQLMDELVARLQVIAPHSADA